MIKFITAFLLPERNLWQDDMANEPFFLWLREESFGV
jgi:hypothetical protein